MEWIYKILIIIAIFLAIFMFIKINLTIIKILLFLFIIYMFISLFKKENYTHENLYISDSKIHGKGLFSDKNIKEGEIIIGNFFTDKNNFTNIFIKDKKDFNDDFYIEKHGLYINHSSNPNSTIIKTKNNNFYLISIKDIKKDEEIFVDYDITHEKFNFIEGSKKHYK
jgi:hypothetical protein